MMIGLGKTRKIAILLVAMAVLLGAANAQEQKKERPDLSKLFEKKEVMIPMRDGVKLHTEIYTPRDAKQPLPFLMERSPYGISAPDKSYSGILFRYSDLWPDGYIFVLQDIRGRYGSEGQFAMNRPVHDPKDPKGIDESTDTYDTIDWLVKNVANNNGRVGIAGISRRISGRDGDDRSSPCVEGRVGTGVHGRRVDGRRLFPSWRVSVELRL